MSAHTPAPWKAEVNEKSATINILGLHTDYMRCRDSDDHGSIVIVECASAMLDDTTYAPMLPEQVANARLIAAAPEMYAALQGLVNHYVALINSGDAGSWNPEEEPVVAAARAALAKAT